VLTLPLLFYFCPDSSRSKRSAPSHGSQSASHKAHAIGSQTLCSSELGHSDSDAGDVCRQQGDVGGDDDDVVETWLVFCSIASWQTEDRSDVVTSDACANDDDSGPTSWSTG
jgi:hypothetical protein